MAGTKVDWLSQHSVYPDYFRKLFYKTGNLFPQFAAELGGGQNIWNFSYYGLYSPLFWISFLLPWVKMTTYMQGLLILEQVADGILCYFWIRNHCKKENSFYGFVGALLLVLTAPMIYHSMTQIMFVDYMPFLLLTLAGYDRYEKTNKYGMLVSGTFLMVLTSYYFSIGGLFALFIYGVCGLKKAEMKSLPVMIRTLWCRFYPVLFGVFLNLFYLVPTFLAMQSGRSAKNSFSLKELFFPDVTMSKFLYHPYGLGLTAIAFIAICTSVFYRKCREKWLGICILILLICPVFAWGLNGGLYIRAKALIPFLPLIALLAADYFSKLGKKKLNWKWTAAGYALAAAILFLGSRDSSAQDIHWLYIDMTVCAVAILLTYRLWKHMLCLVSAGTFFIVGIVQIQNMKDSLVTTEQMQQINDASLSDAMEEILAEDQSIYRIESRDADQNNGPNVNRVMAVGQNLTTGYSSVSNTEYMNFRSAIGLPQATRNKLIQSATDNPVFLRFMGVKYLVGSTDTVGYEMVKDNGANSVYENTKTAPFCYVTNQTISTKSWEDMNWAERQMTLLESVVTSDGPERENNSVSEISYQMDSYDGEEGSIEVTDEKTAVELKDATTRTLTLENTSDQEQYLFLSFQVDNQKNKDVSIKVNGQKNKLTKADNNYYNENTVFHYTCALQPGESDVTIQFGSGKYNLSDIQCYVGTEDTVANASVYTDKIQLAHLKSGNGYEGTVQVTNDGYLVTSIPYDDGFEIYVDGSQVQSQRVNTAFLGSKMTQGKHRIQIRYRAAGSMEGRVLSCIVMIVLVIDWSRKKWKKQTT